MTQPYIGQVPQWSPEAEQLLRQTWAQQFAAPPAGTPAFEAAQTAAAAAAPVPPGVAATLPAAAPTGVAPPTGGGGGGVIRAAARIGLGLAVIGGVGYLSYLAWRSFGASEHMHTPAPVPVGADA